MMLRALAVAAVAIGVSSSCGQKESREAAAEPSLEELSHGSDLGDEAPVCAGLSTSSGLLCEEQIRSRAQWEALAVPVEPLDQVASTKYLVPSHGASRLPTLFLNSFAQVFHIGFLQTGFPEWFSGISNQEYFQLTLNPTEREFFAGTITEFVVSDGTAFVVNIWDDDTVEGSLSCEQFQYVVDELQRQFRLGRVQVVPVGARQLSTLTSCDVPMFVHDFDIAFESYTPGEAYGTLRRLDSVQLTASVAQGRVGSHDILLLEEAPFDLEVVVAATITGTRQGELSHLNLRSSSRGTLNCYDQTAFERLARWDNQLVRLRCSASGLEIEAATREEAQAGWERASPDSVEVATASTRDHPVTPILDVPVESSPQRLQALQRFGAKGANLAVLYQVIPTANQFPAMAIPFVHQQRFMQRTSWRPPDDAAKSETLEETLDRWLSDSQFTTDFQIRSGRLSHLRSAISGASCDPELIDEVAARAADVFGSNSTMLRFRSSSNAEDSLQFNGAGLYDSFSGCLADDADADELGPSLCDAGRSNEKTACQAILDVWASLWNLRAFEERSWFGIDHRRTHMAILVNPQTPDEQANVVAFTGNPTLPEDPRFLINAQVGEYSVVRAPVGVAPEKTLLQVDGTGNVTEVVRIRPSTELDGADDVLSRVELEQLGGLLFDIRERFPLDSEVPGVLLDTEWKVTREGALVVKQIRPFVPRQ